MSEQKKASEIIIELKEQVQHLTRLVSNQDMNIKLILKKLNGIESAYKEQARNIGSFKVPQGVNGISSAAPASNSLPTGPPVASTPAPVDNKGFTPPQRKFVDGLDAVAMKAQHAKQENKTSKFEAMKVQAGIVDTPGSELLAGVARPLGPNGEYSGGGGLEEATSFTGTRRGARVDRTQPDARVKVNQMIYDSDRKPLPLATVKITNSLGQTVKSARSNPKGVWKADLNPGSYNIHVMRRFANEPNKTPVEMQYTISVPNTGGKSFEIPFQGPES